MHTAYQFMELHQGRKHREYDAIDGIEEFVNTQEATGPLAQMIN